MTITLDEAENTRDMRISVQIAPEAGNSTFSDGTLKYILPDGLTETYFPDGRVEKKLKNGNIILDCGKVIKS